MTGIIAVAQSQKPEPPRRVIYCASSVPAYVDLAARMRNVAGWDPCYWIGRSSVAEMVAEEFPRAVFHDHHEAIWAKPGPSCPEFESQPLAPSLLMQLSECESIALRMMDRIDYADLLGHEERRQLYLRHVRYWSAVLDKLQPDILFNTATPHQVYDFVLYELCKLRGIQTIMIGLCFDLNRMFCKAGYVDGSGSIPELYGERAREIGAWDGKLVPDIDECVTRMQERYNHAMPWYIAVLIKDEAKQPPALTIGKVMRATARLVYHGLKSAVCALSTESARWKVASANWQVFRRWLYQELGGPLRVSYLRRYYSELSGTVDFTHPYIYMPLHYQPEMTTVPEGGYFSDQCLVIEMLSKAAPEGWHIYVKEHPIQMTYAYGTNRAARSFEFYDRIAVMENVTLVPLDVSPFALIDNAQVVATVTGTSGWEALVRGKPVFHFGHPWWMGCAGAFPISSLNECQDAFAVVQNGFRVDPKMVRLFAHVLDQESCPGDLYRERELQRMSARDNPRVAELVDSMAKVIKKFQRRALSCMSMK